MSNKSSINTRLNFCCLHHHVFDIMPDKLFIQWRFKKRVGYRLNLTNPQTFNEKLSYLKLYDHRDIYTTLADKYAVYDVIERQIGAKYLIPLLGVWDSFDSIDFDALPNQFVLKATHDSGSYVICTDKQSFDIQKAKKKLEKALKRNYYMLSREWQYKNIPPRIIAQKYMADEKGKALKDYKVLCCNGKARVIHVNIDRFSDSRQDYYDTEWNKLDIVQDLPMSDIVLEKPALLPKMLELSEKLAQDYPVMRVDWYIGNNQLYFGELTLYEESGMYPFKNIEHDFLLGSWITLPQKGGDKR